MSFSIWGDSPHKPTGGRNMHEPTNEERAARISRIGGVLEHYAVECKGDACVEVETDVSDLLADIMHFCHQDELDFEDFLRTARMNFEAEVEEGRVGR
jgi:hypothetical protein